MACCAARPPPPHPAPGGPSAEQPPGAIEERAWLRIEDRCLTEHGPPCARSPELIVAAGTLAEALVRVGPRAFESDALVRAEFARAGLGHPNAMAAALFYSGAPPSEADVAAFVAGIRWRFPAREFAVAHVAAGAGAAPGRTGVIVVAGMERLVDLASPPRWLPQAARVTFGGALLPGWRSPRAYLADPAGAVSEVAVRAGPDGGFQGAVPIGPRPGRYVFELMAERDGSGPAVVYLLPIDLSPTPPAPIDAAAGGIAAAGVEPGTAAEALVALVDAFRGESSLPPFGRSPELDAVARAHAEDMAAAAFFGHVSPTRGSLSDRLRAAGVRMSRAAENLALGPSAEAAFAGLLDSPAHRANFLDRSLSRIGVACARSGDSLVFAVVMGAPW